MSKKFIIIPSLFMLFWSVVLFLNKTDFEIETLFGDESILDEIEIVGRESTNKSVFYGENLYYSNKEIETELISHRVFDKNYNKKNLLKQLGEENEDLIDKSLSNKNILDNIGITGFKDDNNSYVSYAIQEDEYYYLNIYEKNNNTNEIIERKVKIDEKFETNNYLNKINTFYLEDKIYLVLSKYNIDNMILSNLNCIYVEIDGDESKILFTEEIQDRIYLSDKSSNSIFSLISMNDKKLFIEYYLDQKKVVKSKSLGELTNNEKLDEDTFWIDTQNGIHLLYYEADGNNLEILIVELSEDGLKQETVNIEYPTEELNSYEAINVLDDKLYIINGNYMENDFITVVDILTGEMLYQGILKVNGNLKFSINEKNN